MINGIHHLNFLVKDLAVNVEYLEKIFQIKPAYCDLKSRHVTTATFNLEHSSIVLVCPTSNEGEPAKILASRGEGLFLVSFNATSLDETLKRLGEHNIFAKGNQRTGLNNWQVIDLDIPNALGPIFQLCETPQ